MKYIFQILIAGSMALVAHPLFAQKPAQDAIDSLLRELAASHKEDTNKVKLLGELALSYTGLSLGKAGEYIEEAKKLADKIGWKKGKADILKKVAWRFSTEANYARALEYDFDALKIYEEAGETEGEVKTLIDIGGVYSDENDHKKDSEYLFIALKKAEESDNQELAAFANLSTAQYFYGWKPDSAIKYGLIAVNKMQQSGNKPASANYLATMGVIYSMNKNYTKALELFNLAINELKDQQDKRPLLFPLINIAGVYWDTKNCHGAIVYFQNALKVAEEIHDFGQMGICFGNIGKVYLNIYCDSFGTVAPDSLIPAGKTAVLKKSIGYLNKSIQAFEDPQCLKKSYLRGAYLTKVLALKLYGNYKEALETYQTYTDFKDSIFSAENQLKFDKLDHKRELDVRDGQIKNQKLEIIGQRRERIFLYSGLAAFLTVIVIIYRYYATQKKTNALLSAEKQKSERLLGEIQIKNKAITDNINYAQRIQSAILPDVNLIHKALGQSFILYLPKDIVSGDFYAFAERGDRVIIIAADCTGHGVSGAFMSMIGSSLLNEIINDRGVLQPAMILNQLNSAVIEALKQTENESNDGMDVAICSFDLNRNELQYAAANRPLWLARKDHMEVVNPDKFPIGGLQAARDRTFTNHTLQLEKHDTLYIFTDGFADQFGGEKGKKMMTKKFKELLLSIQNMPMPGQAIHLKAYFDKWKADDEQVDDVLVIGIRV